MKNIVSAEFGRDRVGRHVFIVIAALALAVSGTAGAQEQTLGAIVAKGSKKLSADEVRALLTGGAVSDEFGGVIGVAYKADGSLEASWSAQEVRGNWTVDNNGLECVDAWDQWHSERWTLCRYWFKLGDEIYVLESDSDTDRQQPVRRVKTASR